MILTSAVDFTSAADLTSAAGLTWPLAGAAGLGAAWAAALAGLGLLVVPSGPARARLLPATTGPGRSAVVAEWCRAKRPVLAIAAGGVLGALLAGPVAALLLAAVGCWWFRRREGRARVRPVDPLALAAGWDLFAAGMRAGLPPVVLVRAIAAELTGTAGDTLREVAGLLELGADPVAAWEPALRDPGTAELARAARRTARTGSALAEVAAELAAESRAALADRAQARAQRAAVWVAAPLGLCFLPAFLCLGVLPVVVGMAQRLPLP